MTAYPGQLRAFMVASLGIEAEATRGSPEDYDDRNGYLPDFLGVGSDFLVPLPTAQGHGRPRSGRGSAEGKAV